MSTHSVPVPGPQNSSVSEVVRLVDTELHDLIARREELCSRIQNLHQVMYGLREVVKRNDFDDFHFEFSEATDQPGAALLKFQRARGTVQSTRRMRSRRRCEMSEAGLRLRRACRIALMEGTGAASLEEIYSRIMRRGSFVFSSYEFATPALVQALQAMTVEGEVCSLKDGPQQRWERVAVTKISF